MSHEFVAHVRKSDKVEQSVLAHLSAVAALSKTLAAKLDTGPAGELIGLVHDLGIVPSRRNFIIAPGDTAFAEKLWPILSHRHTGMKHYKKSNQYRKS